MPWLAGPSKPRPAIDRIGEQVALSIVVAFSLGLALGGNLTPWYGALMGAGLILLIVSTTRLVRSYGELREARGQANMIEPRILTLWLEENAMERRS